MKPFKNMTMDQLEELGAAWGTYGPKGEFRPKVKIVPLTWCETSHLKAILKTQNPGKEYKAVIERILELRGKMSMQDLAFLDAWSIRKQRDIVPVVLNNDVQINESADVIMLKETEDKALPLLINHRWASIFTKNSYKERMRKAK